VGYSIRDFLSRNGVPYEWVDVDDGARSERCFPQQEMGWTKLTGLRPPGRSESAGFPRDSVVCEGSASHAAL